MPHTVDCALPNASGPAYVRYVQVGGSSSQSVTRTSPVHQWSTCLRPTCGQFGWRLNLWDDGQHFQKDRFKGGLVPWLPQDVISGLTMEPWTAAWQISREDFGRDLEWVLTFEMDMCEVSGRVGCCGFGPAILRGRLGKAKGYVQTDTYGQTVGSEFRTPLPRLMRPAGPSE